MGYCVVVISNDDVEERIMSKLSELTPALAAVDAKLDKISTETKSLKLLIMQLQELLSNTPLPPEADALLTSIQEKAQAIDDQVED